MDLILNTHSPASKQELYDILKSISDTGHYLIKIERVNGKGSINYRKYYFGVIVPYVSDFTGDSLFDTHKWLKEKFLSEKPSKLSKFRAKDKVTTVTLDNEEWGVFSNMARIFFYDTFGLLIPEPEQVIYE